MEYKLREYLGKKANSAKNTLEIIAVGATLITLFIGLSGVCLFSKKIRNALRDDFDDEYFIGANNSIRGNVHYYNH